MLDFSVERTRVICKRENKEIYKGVQVKETREGDFGAIYTMTLVT